MTELQRYMAEEVAEDHIDGILTRREALRRLGLLGVTGAAASALLAQPVSAQTACCGARRLRRPGQPRAGHARRGAGCAEGGRADLPARGLHRRRPRVLQRHRRALPRPVGGGGLPAHARLVRPLPHGAEEVLSPALSGCAGWWSA